MVAVAGVTLASGVGAQERLPHRIGFGLDVAGAQSGVPHGGNFAGPSIGFELGRIGAVNVRADGSLQFDPWSRFPRYDAVVDGFRGPYSIDERLLRGLAIGTVAVELGSRDRSGLGGMFVAARAGAGAGHWKAGEVRFRDSPSRVLTYREPGYTQAVVVVGAEAGLWIPAFGRPNRVAIRLDAIDGRSLSMTRLGLAVLRY